MRWAEEVDAVAQGAEATATITAITRRQVFGYDLQLLVQFMEAWTPLTKGPGELCVEHVEVPIVSHNGYRVAVATYRDEQWGFDFAQYGEPL